MSPEIRQIREEDIESFHAAVDIVARERLWLYLTEAPPLERMRSFVRSSIDKGTPHIILASGDTLAGWCTIVAPERAVQAHVGILAMGLRPEWRGQGWGTKLMQSALDAGEAFGFTRIELTVFATNLSAAALYRKLGFAEEGIKRRSVLVGETFIDEIMMARLTPPRDPARQTQTP